MKRRQFLEHTTAAVALLTMGCGTDLPEAFTAALPIPPLLNPSDEGGSKLFELTVQAGQTEFLPGSLADTIGYNGAFLGPTLRVRDGDDVIFAVTNRLDETTTTHWHGAHLPASEDGGPHQLIEPGQTWRSTWTVNQKAAMNWYHPHREGHTARQVYFGMAGLLFIDDDESDALDLPRRYGVDDIPLVVQDRRFTSDGQLEYDLGRMDERRGFSGDAFLVNGVLTPYLEVEAKELRLRILNGSNGRFYLFSFDDSSPFSIVGGDNSLLAAPVSGAAVSMSPGERSDLVIDLTDRLGETIYLMDVLSGTRLVEIRINQAPTVVTSLPTTLATLDAIDEASVVRTRPFRLTMRGRDAQFFINGVQMDMEVINERVPLGETEIWEVENASGMAHNFHIHATHFRILSRTTGERAYESGYKDTVSLADGETARLLVTHIDYADADHPYMYHCHILEHEDRGMMGQFVVIDPAT